MSLSEDLQLVIRNIAYTDPEDQERNPLVDVLFRQRDTLIHNPAWISINNGTPPLRPLTYNDWTPVGAFFFGLRALQTIVRPQDALIPFGRARKELPTLKGTLIKPFGPLLKDGGWVAVFNQARRAVRTWNQRRSTQRSTPSLHHMQRMIDQLDQYNGKEDYIKIIQNVYHAALHIAWLEQGIGLEYPDTPDALLGHLQAMGGSNSWQLPKSLQGSSYKPNHLQFPLHSSLAITSLLLLRPIGLSNLSSSREALLEVTHALGPHDQRPAILQEIESWMWSHLLQVSRGQITADDFLQQLVNHFSEDLLNTVSASDNHYFALDSNQLNPASTSGSGRLEEISDSALVHIIPQGPPHADDSGSGHVEDTGTTARTAPSPREQHPRLLHVVDACIATISGSTDRYPLMPETITKEQALLPEQRPSSLPSDNEAPSTPHAPQEYLSPLPAGEVPFTHPERPLSCACETGTSNSKEGGDTYQQESGTSNSEGWGSLEQGEAGSSLEQNSEDNLGSSEKSSETQANSTLEYLGHFEQESGARPGSSDLANEVGKGSSEQKNEFERDVEMGTEDYEEDGHVGAVKARLGSSERDIEMGTMDDLARAEDDVDVSEMGAEDISAQPKDTEVEVRLSSSERDVEMETKNESAGAKDDEQNEDIGTVEARLAWAERDVEMGTKDKAARAEDGALEDEENEDVVVAQPRLSSFEGNVEMGTKDDSDEAARAEDGALEDEENEDVVVVQPRLSSFEGDVEMGTKDDSDEAARAEDGALEDEENEVVVVVQPRLSSFEGDVEMGTKDDSAQADNDEKDAEMRPETVSSKNPISFPLTQNNGESHGGSDAIISTPAKPITPSKRKLSDPEIPAPRRSSRISELAETKAETQKPYKIPGRSHSRGAVTPDEVEEDPHGKRPVKFPNAKKTTGKPRNPISSDLESEDEDTPVAYEQTSAPKFLSIAHNKLNKVATYQLLHHDGSRALGYEQYCHSTIPASQLEYVMQTIHLQAERDGRILGNGKQNHRWTRPADYPIREISVEKWEVMSIRQRHNLYRNARGGILVRGRAVDVKRFNVEDENHIERLLGDMDQQRTLHDESRTIRKPSDRYTLDTLRDVQQAVVAQNKVVNCLEIPLPNSMVHPPEGICTREQADTAGLFRVYKKGQTWGLFATSHAIHPFHVDSEGQGTWIMPRTGRKYWVVAVPALESDFGSTVTFGKKFRVDGHNGQNWSLYGFILEPGDLLIMPPCTPHFVLTPNSSISHGGHFYSSLSMTRTAYSFFHNFVAADTITNTIDYNALEGLYSIAAFWHHSIVKDSATYLHKLSQAEHTVDRDGLDIIVHLPNFLVLDDLINFLSLVNLVKLGTVLDIRRYREESGEYKSVENYVVPTEVIALAFDAREWATELQEWVLDHFYLDLIGASDGLNKDSRLEILSTRYLCQQAKTLVYHKVVAERLKLCGNDETLTADVLKTAIETDVINRKPALKKLWPGSGDQNLKTAEEWAMAWSKGKDQSYAWEGPPRNGTYIVRQKSFK